MIFDMHTYVGHFPFRPIRHNTPDALMGFLNQSGVDSALVSNLNGVFYRDVNCGNLELAAQMRGSEHCGKFLKACIINPCYPACEEDFIHCVDKLGFRALQLYPYYHGYHLSDDAPLMLLDLAAKKNIPVHLPCAIENIRQKHVLDTCRNLEIDEVVKALSANKTADIIISNGASLSFAKALRDIIPGRSGRVFYDFNRMEVFTGDIDKLLDLVGAEHVVFGSAAPMQYVEHQLVKLRFLNRCDSVKERILYKNAATLFAFNSNA